jgi:hypothetical protein
MPPKTSNRPAYKVDIISVPRFGRVGHELKPKLIAKLTTTISGTRISGICKAVARLIDEDGSVATEPIETVWKTDGVNNPHHTEIKFTFDGITISEAGTYKLQVDAMMAENHSAKFKPVANARSGEFRIRESVLEKKEESE